MKLASALISRRKSYHLVIKDSACSNHIESATQQWKKSAPPILSTSYCEFIHVPTLKKPSPWHQFTRLLNKYLASTFIVSIIISPKLVQIVFTGILYECYKGLPSFNNIFTCVSFFLVCLFHFIAHFFVGLRELGVNPRSFSLFVHSLVCPITHSFLDGFQPNLVQHSPHV